MVWEGRGREASPYPDFLFELEEAGRLHEAGVVSSAAVEAAGIVTAVIEAATGVVGAGVVCEVVGGIVRVVGLRGVVCGNVVAGVGEAAVFDVGRRLVAGGRESVGQFAAGVLGGPGAVAAP